ncbi:MAG: hypothetical protein R6W75_09325 [Smithellaceae bacterium]
MNGKAMIKQILDFNKKAFDDSFSILFTVREHSEKMARVFWETADPGHVTDRGRKVIEDWMFSYKNGLGAFKAEVDSRFEMIASYLSDMTDPMKSSMDAMDVKKVPVKRAAPKKTKAEVSAKPAQVKKPVKKAVVGRKKTMKHK